MVPDTDTLLQEHEAARGLAKWDIPFPMGVFGTLRKGWGNTGLMGCAPGQDNTVEEDGWYRHNYDYSYESHHKAFLPHWSATGLSISHSLEASCVCEVFVYTSENWKKMIGNVDSLEGFRPGNERYKHSYHRTLAWLHLLPDDYKHEQYAHHSSSFGHEPRTLDIPCAEWFKYPRIPCWVYGSIYENELSKSTGNSPIIWDGY